MNSKPIKRYSAIILSIIILYLMITGCASEEITGDAASTTSKTSGTCDAELKNDMIRCGFLLTSSLEPYAEKARVDAIERRVADLE